MVLRGPFTVLIHPLNPADKLVIVVAGVPTLGAARDRFHLHRIIDDIAALDRWKVVTLLRQVRIVSVQINSRLQWIAIYHLIAALTLLQTTLVLLTGRWAHQRLSALHGGTGRANAMNLP